MCFLWLSIEMWLNREERNVVLNSAPSHSLVMKFFERLMHYADFIVAIGCFFAFYGIAGLIESTRQRQAFEKSVRNLGWGTDISLKFH